MHDTAFHIQMADRGVTQSHDFIAIGSLRTDTVLRTIVLHKPESPLCHRRFCSISSAIMYIIRVVSVVKHTGRVRYITKLHRLKIGPATASWAGTM